MKQTILYYPSINIENEQWLRQALLYWDKVSSIVPNKKYDAISKRLEYLGARKQYTPVYPMQLFVSELGQEFVVEVERRFRRKRRLMEKQQREITYNPFDVMSDNDLYQAVYYDKIPRDLFRDWERWGYIRISNVDRCVEMSEEFATIYMRTLAEYIAKLYGENMVIGTDSHHKMSTLFAKTKPDRAKEMLSLSLAQCLPVPRNDVELRDVIIFKRRHKEELDELRRYITELEKSLSMCGTKEGLEEVMNSFKTDWERKMTELNGMFCKDGVAFVKRNFWSFIESSVVSGDFYKLLNSEAPSESVVKVSIGTGLASLALEYRNYKNKIKEYANDPAFAYILAARQHNILKN